MYLKRAFMFVNNWEKFWEDTISDGLRLG